MINFDKETQKLQIRVKTETQLMEELEDIFTLVRNKLMQNGYTHEQAEAYIFAAFRVAMENQEVFPYSSEARAAIAKLNATKKKG